MVNWMGCAEGWLWAVFTLMNLFVCGLFDGCANI
jgi:hypothetical protein